MTNRKNVGETIYKCIVDLRDRNRVATRQVVASITGYKLSVVDDHIKRMRDDGRLRSPVNGVVEPVDTDEDRIISTTFLPDGGVKVEIGDELMTLTLREANRLGMALGGLHMQFRGV